MTKINADLERCVLLHADEISWQELLMDGVPEKIKSGRKQLVLNVDAYIRVSHQECRR